MSLVAFNTYREYIWCQKFRYIHFIELRVTSILCKFTYKFSIWVHLISFKTDLAKMMLLIYSKPFVMFDKNLSFFEWIELIWMREQNCTINFFPKLSYNQVNETNKGKDPQKNLIDFCFYFLNQLFTEKKQYSSHLLRNE